MDELCHLGREDNAVHLSSDGSIIFSLLDSTLFGGGAIARIIERQIKNKVIAVPIPIIEKLWSPNTKPMTPHVPKPTIKLAAIAKININTIFLIINTSSQKSPTLRKQSMEQIFISILPE
ncbi:hypothetical protein [Chitinimonas sp. BJB300]|uniref:hypothetical protein n=1 Tax=Chitinimonas sp. BJB300 TaxID=1559339 RepID=UPI00111260BF|nr:hypothetical protein [Chitinimonas sp. BJB300]TSJ88229.1 hypothetical protein FG002_012035 [Chitinimonas sp. BJB300]